MAQFAGRRGTGWLWIVIALIVILAVAAVLILSNPSFSQGIMVPRSIPGY